MGKGYRFLLLSWVWLSVMVLVSIVAGFIVFLLYHGLPSVNLQLFFGDTPVLPALLGQMRVWDALWPACVGTFSVIALAALMAIPLGIGCGIYLAQYASPTLRKIVSFNVELLAGTPSIVMGLFGFSLILFLRKTFLPQANTCLLLSAFCLALLILPYLIFTTQTALENVTESQRLIGPSLGFSRLQTLLHVLLPSASKGIFGGVVLAVGRAAEDTAVIMLTGVIANAGLPRGVLGHFEALPFRIFYLAAEYRNQAELDSAYGTAFVLLCVVGALFSGAYALHKTMEWRWTKH